MHPSNKRLAKVRLAPANQPRPEAVNLDLKCGHGLFVTCVRRRFEREVADHVLLVPGAVLELLDVVHARALLIVSVGVDLAREVLSL